MDARTGRSPNRRASAIAFCTGGTLVLLTGCGAPAAMSSGTVQSDPVSSASAQWGGYGGRDEACTETANNVISLGLVPTNLSFATDSGSTDDIRSTIQEMEELAPTTLRHRYEAVSVLIEQYGNDLPAGALPTSTPNATTTPSATPPSNIPGPPATASPTANPVPRFDSDGFDEQINEIATWLQENCSG